MMRIDDDDNNFPTMPFSHFIGIAFEDVYLNYHFLKISYRNEYERPQMKTDYSPAT